MKLNKYFPRRSHLHVPLAGLLLSISLLSPAKPVLSREYPASKLQALAAMETNLTNALKGELPQRDGIYLYSQSPQPNQIGKEYMVFEVRQGKITGAFYLPYSEFSCFSGTLNAGKLALMVANAPDIVEPDAASSPQNPQKLAAISDRTYIGNDNSASVAYPYAVALRNYYQLPNVSNSDHQILQTCKSSSL